MLKPLFSLLFIAIFLNSCCNCDCPDEAFIQTAEISTTLHVETDTVMTDSVLKMPPKELNIQNKVDHGESSEKLDSKIENNSEQNTKIEAKIDSDKTREETKMIENIEGDLTSANPSVDSSSSEKITEEMEDSPVRKQISTVDFTHIDVERDETITLQIVIDGIGNITKASVIKSQTSTTNESLIDLVIEAVKNQLKYSRNTGAAYKYEIYKVNLSAH